MQTPFRRLQQRRQCLDRLRFAQISSRRRPRRARSRSSCSDTVRPFDTLCTMTGAATQYRQVLDIPVAAYSTAAARIVHIAACLRHPAHREQRHRRPLEDDSRATIASRRAASSASLNSSGRRHAVALIRAGARTRTGTPPRRPRRSATRCRPASGSSRAVGRASERRRQSRAFVADRSAIAPRQIARRTAIAPPATTVATTSPPSPIAARPRREIDVLVDRQVGNARPAPRAAPWATTRTRSRFDSTPAPRRPPPRSAASSPTLPGSCTSSSSRQKSAPAPRRAARRGDDREHADVRRQRRELAEERARHDQRRDAARARSSAAIAGSATRVLGDDQRLGRADAVADRRRSTCAPSSTQRPLLRRSRDDAISRAASLSRGLSREVTRHACRSRAPAPAARPTSALRPARRAAGTTGTGRTPRRA